MYMDFALMGNEFPDIDKLDPKTQKEDAFVFDFSKQDMRLLRELFYKMKKDDSEQTDSNHTSSSLTSQDNE